MLREEELPQKCIELLGTTSSARINKLITDIVHTSKDRSYIGMSEEVEMSFYQVREFLFRNVYIGSQAKEQEEKAKRVVKELYTYYMEKPEKLTQIYSEKIVGEDKLQEIVCDYIAGMTDRYAVSKYCELFMPTAWNIY